MKISENLKKNAKPIVLAGAVVACLGVAGVSAYFTDAQAKTNTFTVGKIDIELTEPNWENPDNNDEGPGDPDEITPGEELPKDPKVTNNGNNEAYVFLEVRVPYKEGIITADDDGNRITTAADKKVELFSYDVKTGWEEVTVGTDGASGKGLAVADEGYIRHVYAYATDGALTALTETSATDTLFDYIKFANVVESVDGGDLEFDTLNVPVIAYAIQTENLTDAAATAGIDGVNDSEDDPAKVWPILATQSGLAEDDSINVIEANSSNADRTGDTNFNTNMTTNVNGDVRDQTGLEHKK